jgi:hypothetical protein
MEFTWSAALKDKSFRQNLIVSIILLGIVLAIFFFTLQYAETRNGFVIEKDWLKETIAPKDFSNWIFTSTYAATFLGLIYCFRKPQNTLLLIRTYLLLQLFRTITLLLFPLDPPEGIIPLNDPFLHATFYHGRPNLKDLFFSGHVATLVMFIPVVSNKFLKTIIVFATIITGVLLAAQHVHYIIDVVAAPFFAIAAFVIARKWSHNSLLPQN